ncbi:MAG: tetratricopeptide repeat protein [Deltaproteobacteria bacterium]|nr:tetratricopeptide repeat protein [Deltaproteobacteria bacterium]
MSMWRRALLLLAAVLAARTAAGAEDPAKAAAARRKSYEAAMAAAAETLDRARQLPGARRELALQALDLYRRASQDRPHEPDPHYHSGTVYADLLHDPARAIAAWRQVRALDPAYVHDPDMSFKLGIELSRLGRFTEAITEYDRASSYQAEIGRPDVVLGNSAEAAMGAGLLDEAIRRYRLALAVPAIEPASTALHLFGLAVALDRDEQVYASREIMRRALDLDPHRASMEPERGVFFVPDGDRHYYDGLAHLHAGRPPEARYAFEQFLAVLPGDQYARRARAHVAALAKDPRSRITPVPAEARLSDIVVPWIVDRGKVVPLIRKRAEALRACRPTVPPFGPGSRARAAVSLAIDDRGRPMEAQVDGADRAVKGCVYKRVAAWRFPTAAFRSGARLSFAVTFAPRARR